MFETNNDVRYLYARVIDVVLNLDRPARSLKHAHESVAYRCIPQMADMGGLVRIDVRVLDDDLSRRPQEIHAAGCRAARRPDREKN